MKFLANENFPLPSVRLLERHDYVIQSITELSPGISDIEVLSKAARDEQVILTFDRDYGELIYRLQLPPPFGILYFRYQPLTPLEPAEQLLKILQRQDITLKARFTVLERDQIRQRPLP